MNKLLLVLVLLLAGVGIFFANRKTSTPTDTPLANLPDQTEQNILEPNAPDSLTIASLRAREYTGSPITIEETLTPGSNYSRYLTSYQSDGLKIYGLLTVPRGETPEGGWPAIVFIHGYIPPTQYRTTERYVAYTDAFSRSGYILYRPDLRGHGSSEGTPVGAYGSNAYSIDVLNAIASVRKHDGVNPEKVGIWGHSMGGFLSMRALVVDPKIKASVIWAGVVGSYKDMYERWRRNSTSPSPVPSGSSRRWRQFILEKFGNPDENPELWDSISANAYVSDITAPIQLHHGTADSSVPVILSEILKTQLENAQKPVELFTYPGDDHNLSANLRTALNRSVNFFDTHLK